ncbi:MAG: hypothetical protein IKC23_06115 [Fibrobacter sp.]|nr:hypothetical protein [Fibrobacter sp.]
MIAGDGSSYPTLNPSGSIFFFSRKISITFPIKNGGAIRTTSIYTILLPLSSKNKRHAAGVEGDVESPGGMAQIQIL